MWDVLIKKAEKADGTNLVVALLLFALVACGAVLGFVAVLAAWSNHH
jgi:hypothetical protein